MTKYLSNTTLTIVLLLALVVISILVLNHAFQSTMDRVEWKEETYRVKAGDSLWAISGDYCPDSVDRREWIDEIRALNGLDNSVVHPGQKLIVLAPAE